MICQVAGQLARTPCGVVASRSILSMEDLRRADLWKDDLSRHGTDLWSRTMQLALLGPAGTAVASVAKVR